MGSVQGAEEPVKEPGDRHRRGMEGIWLLSASGSRSLLGVWVGTSVNYLRAHISSSFSIVNDKLFVSDFSPKKTEPVLFIPKPEPSVNSMPTFSLEQQEMVQDFSMQSGMNFQQFQK